MNLPEGVFVGCKAGSVGNAVAISATYISTYIQIEQQTPAPPHMDPSQIRQDVMLDIKKVVFASLSSFPPLEKQGKNDKSSLLFPITT